MIRGLNRRAEAFEKLRVGVREPQEVGAPALLLAVDEVPDVHREAARDLADRLDRDRLGDRVPLRVRGPPAEELAVLQDGFERLRVPLVQWVHGLDVVVVVEDHPREGRVLLDLADDDGRSALLGHEADPGSVGLEDLAGGVRPLLELRPLRGNRGDAGVVRELPHEDVEAGIDDAVHLLTVRGVDHVPENVRCGIKVRPPQGLFLEDDIASAMAGIRVLVLIPDSTRKRKGSMARASDPGVADALPAADLARLVALRKKVATAAELPLASDIDPASKGKVDLMPAYLRYDGNMYRYIPR